MFKLGIHSDSNKKFEKINHTYLIKICIKSKYDPNIVLLKVLFNKPTLRILIKIDFFKN